jgi:hypothetical protein
MLIVSCCFYFTVNWTHGILIAPKFRPYNPPINYQTTLLLPYNFLILKTQLTRTFVYNLVLSKINNNKFKAYVYFSS